MAAFLRFDEKPIRETHQVYEPDFIVVLDPFIGKSPTSFDGLKDNGVAILNTLRPLEKWPRGLKVLGIVDATTLALEEIDRAVVNTCMLGVITRVTGCVKLESVVSSLGMYFEGNLLKQKMKPC